MSYSMNPAIRSAILLACFAVASGAGAAPAVDAAVKTKAQACAACHGADGNKTLDGTYPKLAGQYPEYLAKSLREYRSGQRKNAIMAGQAQSLTDKDIEALSAYYAALPTQIHDLSDHAR